MTVAPIKFVTTNEGKFREVQTFLTRYGIVVERIDAEYPEVQARTLEEVVRFGAEVLAGEGLKGFILEDSGFFIDAYGHFPGVFSKYVKETIGLDGILRLTEGTDRRAHFETCLLYHDGEPHVFRGVVEGTISMEERGTGGFGYDPIFVPEEDTRTFAEMPVDDKNGVSHRGRALEAFAEYILSETE